MGPHAVDGHGEGTRRLGMSLDRSFGISGPIEMAVAPATRGLNPSAMEAGAAGAKRCGSLSSDAATVITGPV